MASELTANLALPYLAAAQAQKHVTHNDALRRLDALVQMRLESVSQAAPPPAPAEGARWFVPASGGSGVFAGKAGQIAAYEAGVWDFLACGAGFLAYIADQRRLALYDGAGAWVSPLAASLHRAAVSAAVLEEDVYLFGASVSTAMAIPDRAIVLGVSCRTLEAVSGASAYNCGTAAEPAKFGGLLGIAAGSTNSGVVGPTAYYAATPVVIGAVGGAFTGGMVRVAIHSLACEVPAAEPAVGYGFANPQAASLVARMAAAPTNARKSRIDGLVGALVAAGIWGKLDALWLLAAHDAQAARLNWIGEGHTLTAVNSPAFTADRGFAGDAATAYLATGFSPVAVPGAHFTRNSASYGVCVQAAGTTNFLFGAANSSDDWNGSYFSRYNSGQANAWVNGRLTWIDAALLAPVGLYTVSRTDASGSVLYRDGAAVLASTYPSAAIPDLEMTLLGVNTGAGGIYANSNDRVSAAFVGAGLSAAEVAALSAAIRAYLVAIGA